MSMKSVNRTRGRCEFCIQHRWPPRGWLERYLANVDMRYVLMTIVLSSALCAAGCSSENLSSPADQGSSDTESAEAPNAATAGPASSSAVVTSPSHQAVIAISAAKKGEEGPLCSSEMTATGELKCGPVSSLTEISWEFADHRDGSDYYNFNWNVTTNGEPKNTKHLTVGFDGETETTVIDAEHFIVIRKGPLDTSPGATR